MMYNAYNFVLLNFHKVFAKLEVNVASLDIRFSELEELLIFLKIIFE